MQLLPPQEPALEMPKLFNLGETNAEIPLNSIQDFKNAVMSMTKQANRSILIYSQDLDAPVYSHEQFAKNLFEVIKHYKNAKVQILVRDSKAAVRQGHAIIKVAQRFSTYVEVKNIQSFYNEIKASFMVVDNAGLIFRNNSIKYEGTVNFNSRPRAAKLSEFFTEVWEKSEPDPYFRNLHI